MVKLAIDRQLAPVRRSSRRKIVSTRLRNYDVSALNLVYSLD